MSRRSRLLRPAVLLLLLVPTASPAEDVPVVQWEPKGLPFGELAELEGECPYGQVITWLPVGTPGCSAPSGRGAITPNEVWCFEVPDNLWPSGPPGVEHTWRHWAWHDPPNPKGSRWHPTTFHSGTTTGTFNAWCGCDNSGTVPACDEVAFWGDQVGYGDGWEDALTLDLSSLGNGSGGQVTFALRYDMECTYDYLYLEYLDAGTGQWNIMLDGSGTAAVFNGVSGNSDPSDPCDNGFGGALDGNYYDTSGPGYYGASTWYPSVSFPLPALTGLKLRWRASSDKSWSDQDGRGDTDGMAAIDNVEVAFNNGDGVLDDFESGTLTGALVNGVPDPTVWTAQTVGNTYDGWHQPFDPMYKNKGATCTFSDDWMWAAKPDAGAIPESAFRFLLVSPQIPVGGWTGAVLSYSEYVCAEPQRADRVNQLVRYYDSSKLLWSPWTDIDGVAVEAGCTGWNPDECLDLTPFLGGNVDTIQVAFEICDASKPTDFYWGKHATTNYLIDDVSIGSFAGGSATFRFARTDLFHDTFSLSDPAHTAYLSNDEQGDWGGGGGSRPFEHEDSLSVEITSPNGMTAGTVDLWWRTNGGSWNTKPMFFSVQTDGPGEGIYREVIGNDSGSPPEDQDPLPGKIWNAGQLVEYYLKVVDDGAITSTFPAAAAAATPEYLQFQVLPFYWPNGKGEHLLIVNDYPFGLLDFPSSTGYLNPGFTNPVCDAPADLIADALETIYDPFGTNPDPVYDVYNVLSADSPIQTEPRGYADPAHYLGGFMDASGTPQYDAIFWTNGDLVCRSFEYETRLALMSFLDNAGNILASGDNIAHHLGTGGCDQDSVLNFLNDYFCTTFPTATDDATSALDLDVYGSGGLIVMGQTYGLYGDCPKKRRFDRLTQGGPAVPPPFMLNQVILEYRNGGAADNNRPAAILCDRDDTLAKNRYAAVLFGFDISAYRVKSARTDILNEIMTHCFGLADTGYQLVGSSGGVGTEPTSPPFSFALMPPTPNPALGETAIRFSIGRTGSVELAVFDVAGRRVRTVLSAELTPRLYTRWWDGRDDAGDRVGSGVYFYRLKAEGFDQVRKITLLR